MTAPSIPPAISAEAGATFLAAIRAALPDLRLLDDPADRESYRADETAYLKAGLPLAVALPTSTAEVATLVGLAAEHRIPIVPRGAGSGLSGGAAGIEGGLTIALTKMDQVLEIDRENLVVVTQPGILNAELKKRVAAEGLFYAPDPASYEICSIGGNLGTNAGGLCCVKYGQTRDSVLGLEVVLADGRVIRTGGKNVKDTAGYALTHLFVGSQGTLGIITEATLRLRVAPPPRTTMLAFFPSLDGSGDAVARIVAAGIDPVTLELLDKPSIAAVDDAFQLGLDRDAEAMLLVESDRAEPAASAELDAAVEACAAAGATSTMRAADATGGRLAAPGPPSRPPRAGAAGPGPDGGRRRPTQSRARPPPGDRRHRPQARHPDRDVRPRRRRQPPSELHLRPRRPAGRGADRSRPGRPLPGRDRPRRTVTAEHGIGIARRDALVEQVGEDVVGVMRSIKQALDPLGILNPGRVI